MQTNAPYTMQICDLPVLVHHWGVSTRFGDIALLKFSSEPWYLSVGHAKLIPAIPFGIVIVIVTATLVIAVLLRRRRNAA